MKHLSKVLLIFVLSLFVLTNKVSAQETQTGGSSWNVRVTADIVSNYVWRGTPCSPIGPQIQPTLAFTFGNFEIGAWGSTDFMGSYKETDLYASLTVKEFTITVNDYYWPTAWNSKRFFNYKNEETEHILEGIVTYKNSKIPFWLTVGTFFYGADKKWDEKLEAQDPKTNNYSTYIEAGYTFACGADAFIGITPSDGYYGDYYGKVGGFNVINLGVTGYKKIKITDKFELPLKASFILNPQAEQAFLVFGVTF